MSELPQDSFLKLFFLVSEPYFLVLAIVFLVENGKFEYYNVTLEIRSSPPQCYFCYWVLNSHIFRVNFPYYFGKLSLFLDVVTEVYFLLSLRSNTDVLEFLEQEAKSGFPAQAAGEANPREMTQRQPSVLVPQRTSKPPKTHKSKFLEDKVLYVHPRTSQML